MLLSFSNRVHAEVLSANLTRVFSSAPNLFHPPTYSTHYIAPAPWQYWSKANQVVITTESATIVRGEIRKSNGDFIAYFNCSANSPFVMRFSGLPSAAPVHPLNTVISGAGLVVIADASISVNLRNIASDNLGGDGSDNNIKGNASLFSFGDAGIGTSFRVGYYRDGDLAGTERPIYSIMALDDNSVIRVAGLVKATLNKGQSYLFQCPMGTLVESSGAAVMNTSARLDAPGGCGDGAYNPIPPIISLGSEYVIVRGEGNLIAEQTTVVATEPNTEVTVQFFDDNGVQQGPPLKFTIAQAGQFQTFGHGYINGGYNSSNNTGKYSSSRIVTTKNVLVFSGTGGVSVGGGCEVDIATLVPIASCAGSRRVETYKFTDYTDLKLPYFGYILTKSSDQINLTTQGTGTTYNNQNIESVPGIATRKQLGTTGLYLVKFTDANINFPNVITISSASRLTVSMVQQSSAFSMSNFISRFAEKAVQPSIDLTDCTAAKLTADPLSSGPYQWYLNGEMITDATENFYVATVSGNYTVSSMLECGMSAQSLPSIISLCNIDRSIEKTVDIPLPELGDIVSFTLTAKNLGAGNAIGVSVNDLLPSGYTYESSIASSGVYTSSTGVWSIGVMNSNAVATLSIKAKVAATGVHVNNAEITGTQPDVNPSNDKSSASTSTTEGTVTLISIGSSDRSVCVGTSIDEIVYLIGGGASGAGITGLPAGLSASPYDPITKQIKITGTATAATAASGVIYTVTTRGGIEVSKTGVITVKDKVTKPVFSSSSVATRCVGVGNNDYVATSSNSDGILYSLSPAEAGSIDVATGTVTWALDYFGSATITAKAIGCDEKTADLIVTVNPRPGAPETAPVNYCQNQTAVGLTADGENLTWYDDNGVLPGAPTPVTTSVGTTNYYVTQKNSNGCESPISTIKVTVNAVPLAPVVSPITYCQNQTAVALVADGNNLTWYDVNGVLSGAPTPNTSSVGTTNYYVTQKTTEGCESPRSTVTVTVNAVPEAPIVSSISYCQNQIAVALTADGTNLSWYNDNGVLPGAPTPNTSSVGTTNYYVTQKNSEGCESRRSTLTVTINAVPIAPVVSSLSYCQNQTAVALTAVGDNLTWYDDNGVLPAAPTPNTSSVGTTNYYVTQKNSEGCESPRSTVTVTVNAVPLAPVVSSLSYCQNQIAVALTADGNNLTWYDDNGVLSGAPTPNTALVGTTNYYVTQKNSEGCESPRSTMTVTVNAVPSAPVVSSLSYCQNQIAVALIATGTNLTWYGDNGILPGAPTPNTASVGTTNYYVTQKNSEGCESPRSTVTVTVNAVPSAPVFSSLRYCQNQTAVALTATGTNLTWYDDNGVLPGAPTPNTALVGTTNYYVTQKNSEGCESPRSTVTVTVNAVPSAPVVSSLSYCQNQTAVALTATGTNLTWYNDNGILPVAPTPNTSSVGTTNYYVTQKNSEGCESMRAIIKVTINSLPAKPVVVSSGPTVFCLGGSVVLKSSDANQYQWYKNNSIITGAVHQTLIVASSGKYKVLAFNENNCGSIASDDIDVIVELIPVKPVIAWQNSLEICEGNTVQLSSSASSGNIWYRNGVIIPGATNTTFDASLAGRYTLGVISTGGCVSQISDPIDVIINAPPPIPTISTQSSLVICKGTAALLVSSASSGNQWFKNGILINGATSQNYLANAAGNYSVKTKNNSGCESLLSNSISISVEAFELSLTASKTIAEFGSKVELKTSSNLKYKVLNWSPANLFNDAGAINQIFEFKNEIIVTVNAISENGCQASATIKIALNKKRDLFIPNTFTPNGDGKNDFVKVYGTGIESIDWSVYSQWGELIYKSKERDAAWDGSYRGVMQPVGVYVYKCTVRFTDGEQMVKHGSINLLR
ncbi:gliding motility-associated C-terminal domain-containing protein [Pedobacter aquatilis]|uniref:Ig-like domain-containing protein n=1 Tax=Pedobacter aquatilis TaxID=351343 RepID=UPI00292E67C5|nr:gliding motility-associated C-terminal domain-containing protein [Pedobacter aquatilis]